MASLARPSVGPLPEGAGLRPPPRSILTEQRAHGVRTLPSVETPPYDRPGRTRGDARLARWIAWNRLGASGAEVDDAVALRPARGRRG